MFWVNQAICQEHQITTPGKILSLNPISPKFLELPIGYRYTPWTSTQILMRKEIQEIFLFLNIYNSGIDNQVLMTPNFLNWLTEQPTIWAGISVLLPESKKKKENWKLIGLALCYPISTIFEELVKITDQGINQELVQKKIQLLGHTSYLCVDPAFRKKRLAGFLIAQIMRLTQVRGIHPGYHSVNFEIGANYFETPIWVRPLRKSTRLASCLPSLIDYSWKPLVFRSGWTSCYSTSFTEEDWQDFQTCQSIYPVRPTLSAYRHLLTCPIYFLEKINLNDENIGYLGGRTGILKSTDNQLCSFVGIEFFLSSKPINTQITALKFCLKQFRKQFDLVFCYQLGSLSSELLEGISAVSIGKKYLNWYNWSGKYSGKDCLLPLL